MPDDARPFSNCLLDLAPPDIAWFQERSDIILVPIGSCEQHGAHLPLGTDTITALEVSRRAAEKAEVPYAPPLWAGYSPQHMRAAGVRRRHDHAARRARSPSCSTTSPAR